MELRSCNHLHFIRVARGGLATKALNVYRGRPALKFKKVSDLYETGDAKDFNPLPVFRPKFEFECDEVESLHTLTEERKIKVDGEVSESNIKHIDGAKEIDDGNFGNMTLKQIKERCKEKRRKSSGYVGLSKETIETCSLGKGNHFNSHSEEDEYDIMEPLSCWRSRILKKKKTVRKGRSKSVYASSQNVESIVKLEVIHSDGIIFQSSEDFPAPIDVKVDVPELTSSNCKDMIIIAADSSFSCNEPVASCGVVPTEGPGAANNCDLETGTSMITSELLGTVKGSFSGTVISVMTDEKLTTNACGFEIQMPTSFSNEPQYCASNEQSYEYADHGDPKSIPDLKSSGGEILMKDIAEAIKKFSDFSLSEAMKEVAILDQHPKNDSPETVSLDEVHIPVLHPETLTCVNEKSWKTSSGIQVQALDVTINNSLQCMELSNRNDSCPPDGETKDDILHVEASVISIPGREYSAIWNPNLPLSPNGCLVSVADDSPTDEKIESSLSVCADARSSCSPVVHLSIDEPVISVKVDDCRHSKMQHPPERLFSTRMVISPTSQKKLREAMVSTELDDEQYYRYARKLCYRKRNENKKGRLEKPSQIKRAEVIISPKKVRKPKVGNDGFHQNDILKVPQPTCAVRSFNTGPTSVGSSSESAILFSQQQMHDIESVATKLSKELQFMTDIVEETLQSKDYPATSLKYTADEMRLAIQNATRVEESARRSLSIMARDCNRFCKIMKLAENGTAALQNRVCKKRKIVFADEAGGKLCDIKTFEDDMAFFCEG